jgi:hypothetical protein
MRKPVRITSTGVAAHRVTDTASSLGCLPAVRFAARGSLGAEEIGSSTRDLREWAGIESPRASWLSAAFEMSSPATVTATLGSRSSRRGNCLCGSS